MRVSERRCATEGSRSSQGAEEARRLLGRSVVRFNSSTVRGTQHVRREPQREAWRSLCGIRSPYRQHSCVGLRRSTALPRCACRRRHPARCPGGGAVRRPGRVLHLGHHGQGREDRPLPPPRGRHPRPRQGLLRRLRLDPAHGTRRGDRTHRGLGRASAGAAAGPIGALGSHVPTVRPMLGRTL